MNKDKLSRKDQREKLIRMTDEAIESLCQSLEEGKSQELENYLAVMARFPRYSFRNILLIIDQMPDAQYVMGYKAWQLIGRCVRKGEKGIRIFAPMRYKDQGENNAERARKNGQHEDEENIFFRPICVFDISQTEGEPLPAIDKVYGEPGPLLHRLMEFAASKGISVTHSPDLDSFGVSKGGCIEIRSDLEPGHEFHVLVHEIAHEMMHARGPRQARTKAQVETEAEAVAFVVSKAAGLHNGNASRDYIHMWDGDKDTLTKALAGVQKTAAEITFAVLH